MAVLIDPPAWPAHGTLWAHLVSDSSLDELHAFAESAGVPRRAFDLDHYDVAAERYEELVARGALPVSGRDLSRRLAASGLRVPGRERREARRASLSVRWEALLPGAPEVGEVLLDRWHEPHRAYHGPGHLAQVLRAAAIVEPDVPRPVALALWFHDAVHDGVAGEDEERSAALARELLVGLVPADEVGEVSRLVLLTADHRVAADDAHGALVCDADLSILGSDEAGYARYVRQVRTEYSHVPDEAFREGRAAVLRSLLGLGRLFATDEGARRWERVARTNLERELAGLVAGEAGPSR
ncbi:putative metal-dependent HD superfamily phosphohydrolase [Flavimobilis soli]|uniref:Putative metal-dependent HD superfamily phosphohydrolase n=1 Tax=Flavimobilis soli TaxID=442709 RepID=A0A2A9ECT7_9MICO|nr:DUF4031 domain-containing protein [Flavimobilis soli]PFG36040.1 putative metal-dependent HD superfamily phosphohydrolase [Flavimobilis soli]